MSTPSPLASLLEEHGPLPFDTVNTQEILPAIEKGLEQARAAVRAITDSGESPSFGNTVIPLETADEGVDRISSVFYHLLHVQTTEELQALSRELPPKLSAYQNDVMMNAALFRRLEDVEATDTSLDPEQRMVLEDLLSAFRRNGASLSEEDQETLRKIDAELSTCSPAFSENVLNATQAFALWIEDEQLLQDVPESARSAAKEAAKAAGREEEWKFTLDAPSFLAFMTYIPEESLRKTMWTAYASRCVDGDFQNQDLIRKIVELKHRRAQLLGYRDHVQYTLERRMVKSRETLESFYDRMLPVILPAARKDLEQVRSIKEEMTGDPELHPWDMAYFSEILRQQEFDLKQEELRPWFSYEDTLQMLFTLTGTLFDLHYEPDDSIPVYAEGIQTYRVTKQSEGDLVGHLLIDPFPRPGKRPGAWMNALLGQGMWSGVVRRPLVGIVGNLTPPTELLPSLLTMDEARTMFHEFGHALHELLSQCTYRSVAGTRVRWDFVELPSQLMENWLLEEEFLRTIPKHYQTGEPLPETFIRKIQASKTFQKGYPSARQLAFGKLDLAWYTTPPEESGDDLIAFERAALGELSLFPPQEGVAMSPSFQHIFSGGYSSGYYSYKWAEALEADVFDAFLENGLFDPETAKRLEKEILSRGGSAAPEDLFRNFRGRDPDPDALLRRDGLL